MELFSNIVSQNYFMGSWDCDPFGNDTACDWKYDVERTDDLSFISKTIEDIIQVGDKCINPRRAEKAIAAADTLARLRGKFYVRNAYTKSLDEWVANHPIIPPRDLLDSASRAIDRILTPPSELLELWGEGGDKNENFNRWKKHLRDLQDRLR
jgi:hypothetical protein